MEPGLQERSTRSWSHGETAHKWPALFSLDATLKNNSWHLLQRLFRHLCTTPAPTNDINRGITVTESSCSWVKPCIFNQHSNYYASLQPATLLGRSFQNIPGMDPFTCTPTVLIGNKKAFSECRLVICISFSWSSSLVHALTLCSKVCGCAMMQKSSF